MLKVTTLHGGMKLRSISLSKAIEIILILTILMGILLARHLQTFLTKKSYTILAKYPPIS